MTSAQDGFFWGMLFFICLASRLHFKGFVSFFLSFLYCRHEHPSLGLLLPRQCCVSLFMSLCSITVTKKLLISLQRFIRSIVTSRASGCLKVSCCWPVFFMIRCIRVIVIGFYWTILAWVMVQIVLNSISLLIRAQASAQFTFFSMKASIIFVIIQMQFFRMILKK